MYPIDQIYKKITEVYQKRLEALGIESWADKIALAQDSKTPPDKLLELAKGKFTTVKIYIAHRSDIGDEIVKILVNDPDPVVRSAISKSRNISAAYLKILSTDPEYSVSTCAAQILRSRPNSL